MIRLTREELKTLFYYTIAMIYFIIGTFALFFPGHSWGDGCALIGAGILIISDNRQWR